MNFSELEALIREFNARSERTWSGHNLQGDRFLDADGGPDTSISVALEPRSTATGPKYDWAVWKHVPGNMERQEGPYSTEIEVGEADSLEEAQTAAEGALDRYLQGDYL